MLRVRFVVLVLTLYKVLAAVVHSPHHKVPMRHRGNIKDRIFTSMADLLELARAFPLFPQRLRLISVDQLGSTMEVSTWKRVLKLSV